MRLGPVDDATAVTAAQLRGVVERLITAGQWQAGDPHIVIASDAGYDVTRLAWVLRDLPVELVSRPPKCSRGVGAGTWNAMALRDRPDRSPKTTVTEPAPCTSPAASPLAPTTRSA